MPLGVFPNWANFGLVTRLGIYDSINYRTPRYNGVCYDGVCLSYKGVARRVMLPLLF
jgi:hypothetical protein